MAGRKNLAGREESGNIAFLLSVYPPILLAKEIERGNRRKERKAVKRRLTHEFFYEANETRRGSYRRSSRFRFLPSFLTWQLPPLPRVGEIGEAGRLLVHVVHHHEVEVGLRPRSATSLMTRFVHSLSTITKSNCTARIMESFQCTRRQ